MKKSKKSRSATPGLIIVGSIIFSLGMVNPVPFFVALMFVLIYGDKF